MPRRIHVHDLAVVEHSPIEGLRQVCARELEEAGAVRLDEKALRRARGLEGSDEGLSSELVSGRCALGAREGGIGEALEVGALLGRGTRVRVRIASSSLLRSIPARRTLLRLRERLYTLPRSDGLPLVTVELDKELPATAYVDRSASPPLPLVAIERSLRTRERRESLEVNQARKRPGGALSVEPAFEDTRLVDVDHPVRTPTTLRSADGLAAKVLRRKFRKLRHRSTGSELPQAFPAWSPRTAVLHARRAPREPDE